MEALKRMCAVCGADAPRFWLRPAQSPGLVTDVAGDPLRENANLDDLRGRHRHFVQDHVSLFSARTLSQLMERFGLRVRQVYCPARALSLRHGLWWLGRLGLPAARLSCALSGRMLNRSMHIGVGDIVTVIGQKPQAPF